MTVNTKRTKKLRIRIFIGTIVTILKPRRIERAHFSLEATVRKGIPVT